MNKLESKLLLISFANEDNQETWTELSLLDEYQRLISSCVGPIHSRVKLISTKSDATNVCLTNTSRNLLVSLYRVDDSSNKLRFLKWKCDTIKEHTINCHFNHFYDSGLFLLYLINKFLTLNIQLHLDESRFKIERDFVDMTLKCLCDVLARDRSDPNSSFVVCRLDLNDLSYFRRLFRTCLASKFAVTNATTDLEIFLNMCLKAQLTSFQATTTTCNKEKVHFSRIIYLFNDDSLLFLNDSVLLDGVLVKQDTHWADCELQQLINANRDKEFRAILFGDTNSLSGDFEIIDGVEFNLELELDGESEFDPARTVFFRVPKIIKICDFLIENYGINLVLCQKVVHPSVKSHLKKRQVIVIDRLSMVYAQPMAELLGCSVCNSIYEIDNMQDKFLGHLKSITVKKIHGKSYLHFQNNCYNTQTFVVCVQNESFTQEIEYLLNIVQYSFQRTVSNGVVICGGPCFYTFCLCHLWKNIREISTESFGDYEANRQKNYQTLWNIKILRQIFVHFITRLLENDLNNYTLDLQCGHLFEFKSEIISLKCLCGLFNYNQNSNFVNLSSNESSFPSIETKSILEESRLKDKHQYNLKLIDCYESKLNVFRTSRDVLVTLLNIGTYVCNK